MANKKITDYTEILAAGVDDFLDISVDLGGGVYDTRKIKASNIGGSSPLTTKGDLFTYDTADARLPIGTDGQALIADSAEATGLRWGTVSADNMATADLTLTADRTHNFNGNDLIFRTGAANRFRIWNGAGNINNGLAFWDNGSGYMSTSFYIWTLSANNGSAPALRVHSNGVTSFGKNVRFSNAVTNTPATGTRVHITGNGSTSATTALLVENSSAAQLLKIDDSGGFALGVGAAYGDKTNVAIGDGATANSTSSIAIGDGATSTSLFGVALGGNTDTGGGYNVVIGFNASSSSSGDAIGYNASTTSGSSLAVGASSSSAASGIAIGKNALNSGYGVALGFDAETTLNYAGLAVGNKAKTTGNSMIFSASSYGAVRTNSTLKSAEFYLNDSTATFRFGETVDGWLNTTGSFGFGTTLPSASAVVDLSSTTKGFLPPRLTTTEKNAIVAPATGLMVFDSTLAKLCVYTGLAWETITSA